jgi:Tol biopolymer transport system component
MRTGGMRITHGACIVALLASAIAAASGREAVLEQIDLPHNYYWRELYLPQLTTGPSSVSFLPDGDTLVYSMDGSLWRQRIGEDEAVELTHATGAYDFQPDVARDGRSVVFTRYDGKATELWQLDLASGHARALTQGGAVNVEPRLSPDGKRIAWVSTEGTGHFNLFIADIGNDGLRNAHPLLGERKSTLDRYYYSAFDHAINPSWSPDGRALLYVSNPEIGWGTGDLWAVPVDAPAQRRKLLSEETSWSARPELAPDGKRVLFSSYHGRQTHQLWLTTMEGAAPLPLTFGDSDRRNARWSPDGKRIAYIGNAGADGNTQLVVMAPLGGASQVVQAKHRRTLAPTARLTLDIRDGAGQRVPARVSVMGSDQRAHAPDNAWMHADDGFDRAKLATEVHYFHCASPCTLDVPAGSADITVQHGFAHALWHQQVTLAAGGNMEVPVGARRTTAAARVWTLDQRRLARPHELRRPLPQHAGAPGVAGPGRRPRPRREPDRQQGRTHPGHRVLRPARRAGPPARHARAGIPHELLGPPRAAAPAGPLRHAGFLRVSPHRAGQPVPAQRRDRRSGARAAGRGGLRASFRYGARSGQGPGAQPRAAGRCRERQGGLHRSHRLLGPQGDRECLVSPDEPRLATCLPGAGSDTMANYASLRGPVGLVRVFLDTDGQLDDAHVLPALKSGRGFVTNGPLLGLLLDGHKPGDTIASGRSVPYRVALRSPVPVDHLELVSNGEVVQRFDLTGDRTGWMPAARSHCRTAAGCCCARGTTTRMRRCSTCIPTRRPIRCGCRVPRPMRTPTPRTSSHGWIA